MKQSQNYHRQNKFHSKLINQTLVELFQLKKESNIRKIEEELLEKENGSLSDSLKWSDGGCRMK